MRCVLDSIYENTVGDIRQDDWRCSDVLDCHVSGHNEGSILDIESFAACASAMDRGARKWNKYAALASNTASWCLLFQITLSESN